jgi:hypothetical protein
MHFHKGPVYYFYKKKSDFKSICYKKNQKDEIENILLKHVLSVCNFAQKKG